MPINQDDIEFTDGDAPLDNINIEIDDDDNTGSDDPLAIGKEESSAEIEAKAEADRLRSELARSNSEREAALRDRKEKEELLEKERQARLVSDETSVNFAVRAITQEIDSLSDRLIRAKEEGNTSDEVRIQREITEKSGELAQAKTVLDTLKNARNNPPKKETSTQSKQDSGNKDVSPATEEWMSKNAWYVNAAAHKADKDSDYIKKAKAEKIYHDLSSEGKYNVNQSEFFNELDRRLSKVMTENEGGGTKKQGTVTKVNNGSDGDSFKKSADGKIQVKLTPADKKTMVMLKMDQNNPKHQKLFALEKVGVSASGEDSMMPKPLNIEAYRRASGKKPLEA